MRGGHGVGGGSTGTDCAKQKPVTLREVLLAELRSTHNSEEWFVPVDVAVKDLTPEQAAWRDAKGNHSVGQLVYHLWYWDRRSLQTLRGEKLEKTSGNNDDTFNNYEKKWTETVGQLDDVMKGLEDWVATAPEAKLTQHARPSRTSARTTRITSARWSRPQRAGFVEPSEWSALRADDPGSVLVRKFRFGRSVRRSDEQSCPYRTHGWQLARRPKVHTTIACAPRRQLSA